MEIQFVNIQGEYTHRIRYEGGKLFANNASGQSLIDNWIAQGRTPEEFVEKFSSWSNGYAASKVVSE
jgi:hypothetical protein